MVVECHMISLSCCGCQCHTCAVEMLCHPLLPIVVPVLSGIGLSLVLLLIDAFVVVVILCVNFAHCHCHFHGATVLAV